MLRLALVSARMDEGSAEERRTLAPRRRTVLVRLAAKARAAGNVSEAELYESMLAPDEKKAIYAGNAKRLLKLRLT